MLNNMTDSLWWTSFIRCAHKCGYSRNLSILRPK